MAGFGAMMAAAALPLVGDAINYASNERTNYYNTLQTRETNEMNERLFHEQQEFQERMYNQYQSPEALKRQYEEAGFNPYLMMNGNSAGQINSSVGVPQMQANKMIPFQSQGFAQAGSNLISAQLAQAQARQINAAADGIETDNIYKDLHHLSELREQQSRIDKNSAEYKRLGKDIELMEIRLGYERETIEANNEYTRNQSKLAAQQTINTQLQGEYQKLVNNAFPELNQYQLNLLASQSFAAYQSGVASSASANLSNKMAEHEALKAIGTTIENGIKSGQFTLQQLGMSQAQLDALLSGRQLEAMKNNRGNIQGVTTLLDWLVGRVPILKGWK